MGKAARACPHLIHLKSSSDSLNQNSAPDSSARHANVILSQVENVIPQTSFKVRFQLGKIEVRASAPVDQLLSIVEEIETEIEKAAGDGFAIHGHMLLVKVPASSAGNEGGEFPVGAQLVFLSALLEINLSADSIV